MRGAKREVNFGEIYRRMQVNKCSEVFGMILCFCYSCGDQ